MNNKREKVSKCCGAPYSLLNNWESTHDRDGEQYGFLCSKCKRTCDWKFKNSESQFKDEAKKAIRRLLRTSNDALDTIYITDSQTGRLLPVPKGNNTEDSHYNLALIEAEKAIDAL